MFQKLHIETRKKMRLTDLKKPASKATWKTTHKCNKDKRCFKSKGWSHQIL